MTDTLPRTIPTDPAEQERLMPEWVKVDVLRREGGVNARINRNSPWFAHALTIWQWCPEPVDPDLVLAQEVCRAVMPSSRDMFMSGFSDKSPAMLVALEMAKRVRALERGEG